MEGKNLDLFNTIFMPIFPLLFPINLLAFLLVTDLSLRNVIYANVLNRQNSQISAVLHLSDLHFDPRYHPTTKTNGHTFNCHPSEKLVHKGLPMSGPFGGEYSCDSPKLLIEFTLSEVHRIVPSPQMIVFTGDSGPHGAEYSLEEVLSIVGEVSKMLKAQFGTVPVIPALGNHDFPNSQMPDEFHPFYKRVFGLWHSLDWLDNAQFETFSRGGYYTRQISGVTFIVLNTNIYYSENNVTYSNGADPLGQFAFLDEQLEEAKRRNSFVNIVGHIAAGYKDKKDYKGSMRDEYAEKLAIKFADFARWIRWLFFGHRHKDTFRVIKDPATRQALLTMFLSPSINTYKQKNFPAFRVFEYNSSNWQFVDIKTYSVNLTRLNARPPPETRFSPEYSMRDAYALRDLSPRSMDAFVERMKLDENLFAKYFRFYSVQWHNDVPATNSTEKKIHLCALNNVFMSEYKKCILQ